MGANPCILTLAAWSENIKEMTTTPWIAYTTNLFPNLFHLFPLRGSFFKGHTMTQLYRKMTLNPIVHSNWSTKVLESVNLEKSTSFYYEAGSVKLVPIPSRDPNGAWTQPQQCLFYQQLILANPLRLPPWRKNLVLITLSVCEYRTESTWIILCYKYDWQYRR